MDQGWVCRVEGTRGPCMCSRRLLVERVRVQRLRDRAFPMLIAGWERPCCGCCEVGKWPDMSIRPYPLLCRVVWQKESQSAGRGLQSLRHTDPAVWNRPRLPLRGRNG